MVTVTIEDEPQLCCLCLCDYRPNPYLDAVNPTLKATAAKVGRASMRLKPLLMLPSAVHGRNLLHLCCVVASSCSGLTSPRMLLGAASVQCGWRCSDVCMRVPAADEQPPASMEAVGP